MAHGQTKNTRLVQPRAVLAYASASTSPPLVGNMKDVRGLDELEIFVDSLPVANATLAVWVSPDGVQVMESGLWRKTCTTTQSYPVPLDGAPLALVTLYNVAGGSGTTGLTVRGSTL